MIRDIYTKQESDLTFTKIYQEYYRRVFNYAFSRLLQREEAEDATAEVFLIVLQNLWRYDPERASIGTWINRIAHNAVEGYCRKAYRRKEFPAPVVTREEDDAGEWEPEQTVNRRAYRILRQLSEEERTFLALRYELDMTNTEIGELMGLTPASVSQRYHRLLEKCRKLDRNP
jgi:RNA polymerase sigma-70 factor (ECF subfamily)